MSDELREKVARALAHLAYNSEVAWQEFGPEADAAIALVLEEAAKVVEERRYRWPEDIAAAIRALKENK